MDETQITYETLAGLEEFDGHPIKAFPTARELNQFVYELLSADGIFDGDLPESDQEHIARKALDALGAGVTNNMYGEFMVVWRSGLMLKVASAELDRLLAQR